MTHSLCTTFTNVSAHEHRIIFCLEADTNSDCDWGMSVKFKNVSFWRQDLLDPIFLCTLVIPSASGGDFHFVSPFSPCVIFRTEKRGLPELFYLFCADFIFVLEILLQEASSSWVLWWCLWGHLSVTMTRRETIRNLDDRPKGQSWALVTCEIQLSAKFRCLKWVVRLKWCVAVWSTALSCFGLDWFPSTS